MSSVDSHLQLSLNKGFPLQENSLLRTLFEYSLRPAIFVTDPDDDFRFVLVNQAACEHLGASREQIYQWTPADIDPTYTKERLYRLHESLKKSKTLTFESTHLSADKRRIPVEVIVNLCEFDGKQFVVGYFSNIEERKQKEQQRQEEQLRLEHDLLAQQYKKVFDNLNDRVYLLEVAANKKLKILSINGSDTFHTDSLSSHDTNLYLEDVIPSANLALLESHKQICLTTGESCHYEETITIKGNLNIHMDVTLAPITSSQGEIKRIILVARDITEKKRQAEELARKEQEFRALVELSKDAITRYDTRRHRIYGNPAFLETIQPSSHNSASSVSLINFYNTLETVFIIGKSLTLDMYRTVGDEERFYEIHFIPEFDSENQVCSVLCIGRDYSAKKRAEQALQKREEEFRSLVENSLDTISRHDTSGRRIYINPISMQSTGTWAPAIMDTTPMEFPGGEAGQLYQAKIQQVVHTKTATEFELNWGSTVGGKCSLISLVPEQDEHGNVTSILAIGRDISELKKVSQDLEHSQSQLRDLVAYKERTKENERKQIARELHDELGQQLTALRLETQILEVRYQHLDHDFKAHISRIKEQLKNTISYTRSFVSWLRPAVMDLGFTATLEWLIEDIQKLNPECQYNLQTSHEDINLCEEKAIALFRITQESLTNVIKHAQASEVNVSLTVNNNYVELQVKDNGCGFDPQTKTSKSFGLVGIKERAIMIQAEFSLSSQINQGTCLIVKTPLLGEEQ